MQKHTKIVATISDRKCSLPFLTELFNTGVDVFRINTAYQEPVDTLGIVENIRKISDKIPIILDTKGPEVRLTKSDGKIVLKKGERISLVGNPSLISSRDCISVNYVDFVNNVAVGSTVLIDDGEIELVVVEKVDGKLITETNNDGVFEGFKGVTAPHLHDALPSLSAKDKRYIRFAMEHDIEFIAHSFVRNKDDVLAIQELLDEQKSRVKIIAKIEDQCGVDNIDEILDYVYGIMIARGDLALEVPVEKIPGIQKKLIADCIKRKKPVIVATQMLHSMIMHKRPTRAEITDVANAIFEGTDAIMLSGETAKGKFPVEAVETMVRIAQEVETAKKHVPVLSTVTVDHNRLTFLAKSAVKASHQLGTKAIITDTTSGKTALHLAAFRGDNPVYAQCYSARVVRELALSYGICANFMKKKKTTQEFVQETVQRLLGDNCFTADDAVLILAGNFGNSQGASFIEISEVKNLVG